MFTHIAIRNAFDETTEIESQAPMTWDSNAKEYKGNLSDIFSNLICCAGRFCESYASDLLIDCQSLLEKLKNKDEDDYIDVFAFRKNGVDHNSYLISNLENYKDQPGRITDYYRRIMAVRVCRTDPDDPNEIQLVLKDITNKVDWKNDIDPNLTITTQNYNCNHKTYDLFLEPVDGNNDERMCDLPDGRKLHVKIGKSSFNVTVRCENNDTAYSTVAYSTSDLRSTIRSILEKSQ